MIITPDKAALQTETKAQLPVPTSAQTVTTANGKMYLILRFAEGKGPNLAQTKEIAKIKGKEMLTSNEVMEISDNYYKSSKSDNAIINALKSGDRGYVSGDAMKYPEERNPEKRVSIPCIGIGRGFGVFFLYPGDAADVVVLKETVSEAAAPQSRANRLLRTIKDQFERLLRPTENKW